MKNDRFNFAARYLRAEAERRGWRVVLHPDGAFSGQFLLPDGKRLYFVRSTLDLNPAAAALVARDKALTKFYLRRLRYPVIPGQLFFSDAVCRTISSRRGRASARSYARRLGYPIIVKPNGGAGGDRVELVAASEELDGALERAFSLAGDALVERYVPGLRDYRLLLLDGALLLAYERRPFSVTGDGRSSIRQLVTRDRRQRTARAGRPDMGAIERSLDRRGLRWSAIPRRGEAVRLLDVANLTQGGTAVEVTGVVAPGIARLAAEATRDLGLRYCGVDILTRDIRVASSDLYILELNASPTIHGFATVCGLSRTRLLRLYSAMLDAMART